MGKVLQENLLIVLATASQPPEALPVSLSGLSKKVKRLDLALFSRTERSQHSMKLDWPFVGMLN